MRAPALIIADGAPGIWKATRELWDVAIEQRCTVHALRNITSKLPGDCYREVKARYWAVLDEATSPSDAKAGLLALAGDYRHAYPSAMRTSTTTPTSSSRTRASQLPRRDLGALAHLGRARTRQPRVAQHHHHATRGRAHRAPTPRSPTAPTPTGDTGTEEVVAA